LNLTEALPPSLLTASVACGQFVLLAHHLGLDTNVKLAERHCGAVFKSNQRAVDAVVPIISTVPAMVLFQFKNLAVKGDLSSESCSAMYPTTCLANQKIPDDELRDLDQNCVRVYLQLCAEKGSAHYSDDDVRPRVLQIFGLSSRCLSETVIRSLEKLLDASNSIESFLLDQRAAAEVDQTYPLPDDIGYMRRILPFVIDQRPQWNDLTVVELQAICVKEDLPKFQKLRKRELIDLLIRNVGSEPRD
jgi:hypothetical protein